MGNVVDMFAKELKHCSYYEYEDEIGVAMLDRSLIVLPINSDEFEVTLFGQSQLFKRQELAEFFHVTATLLDSGKKYLPKVELVGRNYK